MAMRWLLTRARWPFLAVLLAVTVFFASHAARVGVETNNESLNTRDAEQTALYERFRATFGSDEDVLLAVVHPRLLEVEGLRFLGDVSERIARLPGVRRVFHLANAQQIVRGDAGAEMAPVAPRWDAPDFASQLREAIDRNPELTGLFVSADRRTAGVLIEIEDRPGDTQYRAALIDALRQIVAEAEREPGVELHLTGIAVQKHDVTELIERDRRTLMPLAVVVLGVVLAAFFRRTLGVALPLAVTGITVAWTLGAYQLAGFEVNAITALLPPVLMVLSLGVSVHLIQGWLDCHRRWRRSHRAHRDRRAAAVPSVLVLFAHDGARLRLTRLQRGAGGAALRGLRGARRRDRLRGRDDTRPGRALLPDAPDDTRSRRRSTACCAPVSTGPRASRSTTRGACSRSSARSPR